MKMKKYLLQLILIGCVCLAANPVTGQTTDNGNYGFHLQLSKDQFTYIQTGIYFYAHASDNYIKSEDVQEIYGTQAQMYLSSYSYDNRNLSINTLSDYANGKRIRLYVAATSSGPYRISLADIFGMDTTKYAIYIIDQQKKDSVEIVNNAGYSFYINLADARSFGANRFLVAIEHKPSACYKSTSFLGHTDSPFSVAQIYAISGIRIKYQTLNAALWTNDVSEHETIGSSIIHLQPLK